MISKNEIEMMVDRALKTQRKDLLLRGFEVLNKFDVMTNEEYLLNVLAMMNAVGLNDEAYEKYVKRVKEEYGNKDK